MATHCRQVALVAKNPPANAGNKRDQDKDPLEEGMAAHSSIPAWRTPRTEEPGGCSPQGRTELDTPERLSMHTQL